MAEVKERAEASEIRVVDPNEEAMKELIDATKAKGDTIGGVVEVLAAGVPAGLGSYVQWDSN